MKAMSLLAFLKGSVNFPEIFKGKKAILQPCRNSKYVIKCLYDNTKHCQVSPEKQGSCKVCKITPDVAA